MTEFVLNPSHAGHIREVAVSFCVTAPDLDPDSLSTLTGLQSDRQARRGDERRNYGGQLLAPEPSGWWLLSTRGRLDSKDIRVHMHFLLDQLLPHAETFRSQAEGGDAFFDVLWKSTYLYAGTGPLFDAASMAGVAALGAGLGFDIYQVDEEIEEDPPPLTA